MSDKIIHLTFKNPNANPDTMAFIGCAVCRNKTFTVTEDRLNVLPLMRCAACGNHIGRIGWSDEAEREALRQEVEDLKEVVSKSPAAPTVEQ